MSKRRILTAIAVVFTSLGPTPLSAQYLATPEMADTRPLPQIASSRSFRYFDGRDDVRDFPTNGFFPGDFATNPANAAIGAAGVFGSTPSGASNNPPSQVTLESRRDWTCCARRR